MPDRFADLKFNVYFYFVNTGDEGGPLSLQVINFSVEEKRLQREEPDNCRNNQRNRTEYFACSILECYLVMFIATIEYYRRIV